MPPLPPLGSGGYKDLLGVNVYGQLACIGFCALGFAIDQWVVPLFPALARSRCSDAAACTVGGPKKPGARFARVVGGARACLSIGHGNARREKPGFAFDVFAPHRDCRPNWRRPRPASRHSLETIKDADEPCQLHTSRHATLVSNNSLTAVRLACESCRRRMLKVCACKVFEGGGHLQRLFRAPGLPAARGHLVLPCVERAGGALRRTAAASARDFDGRRRRRRRSRSPPTSATWTGFSRRAAALAARRKKGDIEKRARGRRSSSGAPEDSSARRSSNLSPPSGTLRGGCGGAGQRACAICAPNAFSRAGCRGDAQRRRPARSCICMCVEGAARRSRRA